MSESIWGTKEISIGEEASWEVGDLSLTVKEVGEELWVSSRMESDTQETEWSRWALKKSINSFQLSPSLPDKAIVVKPESPFRLLPGVEARIFVRVPIWLALRLNQKDEKALTEIPSATLSLTWFGDPTVGELCYWISSSAKREVVSDPERNHLAICPVQLKNSSKDNLLVEKICLRVKWLSLYEKKKQLWANETKITYQGAESMSQISVTNGPPKEASKAPLVNRPREAIKRSFSMRTFFSWGTEEKLKDVSQTSHE